jgi:glycosyltransferase involved in cell wall biosynthesis
MPTSLVDPSHAPTPELPPNMMLEPIIDRPNTGTLSPTFVSPKSPGADTRALLIYILHSGNLYGTERMALSTAIGLNEYFRTILFAPPGAALQRAAESGLEIRSFTSAWQLASSVREYLRPRHPITFACTSLTQWAVCKAMESLYDVPSRHVQLVHGGAAGSGAYGRKKFLNWTGVRFITVSDYARDRLVDSGVSADRVTVIHNFLPPDRVHGAPRRPPFTQTGVRKILTVSRLDSLKRPHLLLDALDARPELDDLDIRIIGAGPEFDLMRRRAAQRHPRVHLHGFSDDVPGAMAQSDLLVHLCPVESFGLVVLEAMAADLPVLVPDGGGAGLIVSHGQNGFRFAADNAIDLADRLLELRRAAPEALNAVVAAGRRTVVERYSAQSALEQYRRAFAPPAPRT